MELVDCHTHSTYSDGADSIESNVARACELGLTTIACTDHFVLPPSMDPQCECSVPAHDSQAYLESVEQARKAYPQIDIISGWECDYYPGCEDMIARYRGNATFLLGSVHWLDGQWIDDLSDPGYWANHTVEQTWQRYFEVWCEACSCSVGFSSMAHPDLVKLRGWFPNDSIPMASLYEQAAQAAAQAGVHIEVSSAGLRKPVGDFYPSFELLEAFYNHGVPITVGSDAHKTSVVGDHIEQLYAYAYKAGYREVDVPCSDGGWRHIAL